MLGTAVTDTVISSSQSKKVWPISNDRYSITFMLHFTLQWICLSGLEVSAVLSERMKIWTVKAQRCCYPWVQTKWWRLQGTFSMCSLCFERHCHSQRPLALFLSGYKRLDQDVTVGVVIKNTGGINKRSGKMCTDLREIDMPFKWAFWDRLPLDCIIKLTPTVTLIHWSWSQWELTFFFFTALGCTYALMPK